MKIEVKESDRIHFKQDLVSELERQNGTVFFTSKRFNTVEFNGIKVPDVREINFTKYEVVVTSFSKGNIRNVEITFPLGFLKEIKCLGVFWSEYDSE